MTYSAVNCLRPEENLGVRHRAQPAQRHVGELVLLGLHHERKLGLAAQPVEVEHGDALERRPVPELEGARHQAHADVFVDEAELGENLERGWLRGGGARAVVDPLQRFEQRHRVAEARGGERGNAADRSRADDQDVSTLHGSRRLY